jgi:hypothetical protein
MTVFAGQFLHSKPDITSWSLLALLKSSPSSKQDRIPVQLGHLDKFNIGTGLNINPVERSGHRHNQQQKALI